MENNILDYNENWNERTNYRKYYLLIESILFFIILFLSFMGELYFNHRIIKRNYVQILGLLLISLYIVSPLIRFLRKESTVQLSLIYFLQNGFFILTIMSSGGEPNSKSQLLATLLGLTALLLFNIIPHIELKKYDASRAIHLFLIFINITASLSIIGLWIYAGRSAIAYNSPLTINLLSSFISFILLCITSFLAIRNWSKYFYLGYFIPRLLFAISIGTFQILRFWTIPSYVIF